MDRNRNGILEPNEIPEERKRMLSFMASRIGIDTNGPIAISKVREAAERAMRGGDSKDDKDSKSKEPEPLVPEFGVEQEIVPPAQFGERVANALAGPTGSTGGSSERGGRRGRGSAGGDGNSDDRTQRIVQFMMGRYDANRNGVLEKEEWAGMRTDPTPADRNKDGRLTAEEIGTWMAERMGGGDRGSRSSEGNGSGESSESSDDGRKSYRVLTALERLELLEEELPPSFFEKDANQDGQIAMVEFATFWTDSEARRFVGYDRNNDGVITPREWLSYDGPSEESEEGESESEVASSTPSSESDGGGSGDWWE
jgi:Ca2+-binding EF-hand superfamily protein